MPIAALPNGIQLHYQRHGEGTKLPLLLIIGMGAPLSFWPSGFVEGLVAVGHPVVVFDNRDIGHSTRLDEAKVPSMREILATGLLKRPLAAAYTLDHMADDAAYLLDQLMDEENWTQVGVVGMSMGGMIGLRLAMKRPQQVTQLALVMSSGVDLRPRRYWPQMRLAWHFLEPRSSGKAAKVARLARWFDRIAGAPGRYNQLALRQQLEATYEAWAYGAGAARHFAAVLASPPIALDRLPIPTCVIHGDADPLVPFQAAIETAAQLPHSQLHRLKGVGHELTPAMTGLWLPPLTTFFDDPAVS